ncbi:DUF2637 domain-containing protein [Streptomyces sp. NPDC051320]|uniref:DUF2637 domain-containing protein n=1 Tax=Streptomyces sp. NPDC051320 TaxID=3154644 RepID=UPI0034317FCF
MTRWNAPQSLAAGATVVTVALTGAAFWLSYEHLHDVAEGNGLDSARAWAWPATVDLFIVAGELLILRASLRQRVDWWAITLAAVGSLGSIALNVAGVGTNAQAMEYIVAAVPPSAALIAFGALMRQVHEHLASRTEEVAPDETPALPIAPDEVTTTATLERDAPDPEQVVIPSITEPQWQPLVWPPMEALGDHIPPRELTSTMAAAEPRQVVTVPVTITPSELRKQARKLNREMVATTGKPVTIERLREEYSLSRRDATELRRAIVDGSRS